MANTTNFGWETPDDTDLVKDGAAAMRTLGNSIDASFVDLKGGTTGQVLAKASNTDLDFTWATDASGIPATIFDAKGDLIVASAADTAARLAVGTNDQVLTADSSTATGLKWATPSSGGMTLLSTTTMNAASVTVSSISQDYYRLFIEFINVQQATSSNTIDIYLDNAIVASYSGVYGGVVKGANSDYLKLTDRSGATLNTEMDWSLTVDNYTSTSFYKPFIIYGFSSENSANKPLIFGGVAKTSSAFDQVNIRSDNGTSVLTGTIKVWGIK